MHFTPVSQSLSSTTRQNLKRCRIKQRKLRMELLEERRVLAAVTWDGEAGDGLWTSPLNWSSDAVPGSSDDVEIQAAPAGQVIVRGTVPNIASLTNRGQLFLEGQTDSGLASLGVLGNSANFGSIRLESTSVDGNDRGVYLNIFNNATLLNAGSGSIEAFRGAGAGRQISGNIRNEGVVHADADVRLSLTGGSFIQAGGQLTTSASGELYKTGPSFQMTGGSVTGNLRLNSSDVSVAATVTTPSTIKLVGNNRFSGNQSPVTTLWLESSTAYGYSQLFVDVNATNAGILRMESVSDDGNDQATYLVTRNSATLTNAASGIIDARLGAGDARYLSGSIVNRGVLRSDGASDLLVTGTVQFLDGAIEGKVFLRQVRLDVGLTSTTATLRVVGDSNVLVNNLGTNVTVWLEGSTSYGFSRMFYDDDAINRGTLRLESSSDNGNDQNSYLDGRNNATLVNASGGVIEARTGAGDLRYIRGNFLNEGTVQALGSRLILTGNTTHAAGLLTTDATGEVLQSTGSFVMTGGAASGTVRLNSTNISIAASVTQPTTLRVVGDNNYFDNNLSTQTTLWLEGNISYGFSRLYYNHNVTNFGTIRMESTSDDGNNQASHLQSLGGAIFTNASSGVIRALAGAGDSRYVIGNFANAGTVEALANTRLSISSGQAVQAGGIWQTVDSGEILQSSGSFVLTGGTVAGRVRFQNTTIDTAASANVNSTLRLVGSNYLSGNQSPQTTLWLEGNTTYGYSALYVDQDATNAGTIRMESSSDDGNDQNSYLFTRNNAKFTNAATGTIIALAGAGDSRYIYGDFINFGSLSAAPGEELLKEGGSIVFHNGSTNGEVRFHSVNVTVNASATTATSLRLVGDNNTLNGNQSPNVTLWLEGNTRYGYSRLYFDQNVSNAGPIRMESTSDDGNNQNSYLEGRNGALLTNESTGSIEVFQGAGDGRYIFGNVLNRGTLLTHANAQAQFSGALQQGAGTITAELGGEFWQTGGSFTMSGGNLDGLVRVSSTRIDIAATVTESSTLLIVGDNSVLVGNQSAQLQLRLEGSIAHGYSQLFYDADAIVKGTLVLAPSSNDGSNQSTYLTGRNGATLTIAPGATLDIPAGDIDSRFISGNVLNQGTVLLNYPTTYNGSFINRGVVSSTGASSTFASGSLSNELGAYLAGRSPVLISSTLTNNGTIDTTTGAIITDVQLYPNLATVSFSAAGGMSSASITNLANYSLISSGGDGIFGNGNDVDLTSSLAAVTFDIASQLAGITISGAALVNDVYLFNIVAQNLSNVGGEPLFTSAIPIVRQLTTSIPGVDVDLITASDTGLSSTDNLTNDNTPTFDLLVKTIGTLAVDINGDGQTDQTISIPSPGLYTVTVSSLADGDYRLRTVFTPTSGPVVRSSLIYQIDTVAPLVTGAFPNETAPNTTRRIKFSEALDVTSFNAMVASMSMLNSSNAPIAISSVQLIGTDTLEVTYPVQSVPGQYRISIAQPLPDRAGNVPAAPIVDLFTLTATAVWIGGSGDWSNPSNWQGGRVPTADHDVIIDSAANITVTISTNVTIKSLIARNSITIQSGATLRLTAGDSLLSSSLTVLGSLVGQGVGTTVTATGLVTLTGASLVAESGALVAMQGATAYSMGNGRFIGPYFTASGASSVLDLQNITQLGMGVSDFQILRVEATGGGRINLSRLTQFLDTTTGDSNRHAIRFSADGTNSLIDLSTLTSWLDPNPNYGNEGFWQGMSALSATNSGTILVPTLQNVTWTEIILDATGVMNLSVLSSVSGSISLTGGVRSFPVLTSANQTTITVNGASVSMPLLSAINASSIAVSGGVTLSLPSVTSYNIGDGRFIGPYFTASGVGSVLDLHNITQLSMGVSDFQILRVEATGGGRINLSRLTQFLDTTTGDSNRHAIRFSADGTNSLIDLSTLTSWLDPNPNYGNEGFWQGMSALSATNSGTILVPTLQNVTWTEIILDATGVMNLSVLSSVSGSISLTGGVRSFPVLTSANQTTITVNGASVSMPLLSAINASSIAVSGGVTLSLPSVTSYSTGDGRFIGPYFTASGVGSVLDLHNITQLSMGVSDFQILRVEATGGGRINLSRLTQFLDTTTGDSNRHAIRFSADGTNSLIDLSTLTSWLDPNPNYGNEGFWQGMSALSATNSGTILVPTLQNVTWTEIILDATGVMNLSVLSSVSGSISLTGGVRSFPVLTSANQTTITVNGASVSMPLLSAINASSIAVSGGVTLSLPSVTSYSTGDGRFIGPYFTASGAGSVLDLQNITQLSMGVSDYQILRVEATGGGRINLSRLTQFLDTTTGDSNRHAIRFLADGTNSLIDLSTLTSWLDPNPNYGNEGFWQGMSALSATNSGTILVPTLQSVTWTEIILDATGVMSLPVLWSVSGSISLTGGVRSFPVLTSANQTTITVNGASVSMPLLSAVTASAIAVSGGVTLSLPSVTSYSTGDGRFVGAYFTASGAGSVLDLQNLTQITMGLSDYQILRVEATAGGRINLSRLTQFLDTLTGDSNRHALRFLADGTNSLIDLSALTSLLDPNPNHGNEGFWQGMSALSATNSGTILVPTLQSTSWTEITLDATGVMNFPVLTSLRGGSITVSGATVSIPVLSTLTAATIAVYGGGRLSLPSVTSYSMSNDRAIGTSFVASGVSSVLDLQNITQISMGLSEFQILRVEATVGGHINLSRLTQFLDTTTGDSNRHAIRFSADGTNSLIDLSALTSLLDPNPNYGNEGFWQGLSALIATAGGRIQSPVLASVTNTEVIVSGTTSIIVVGSLDLGVNSTLSGTGTLQGNVTNRSGVVRPGENNIGRLTITGNFTQLSGGSVVFELAGQEAGVTHDQLMVGGALDLNGTLTLTRLNGYIPTPGTAMAIIANAASRTGQFAILQGLLLPNNREFTPVYSSNGVTIATETSLAPYVIGLAPASPITAPVTFVDVLFSKPIDPASFTVSDVSLSGPSGSVPITAIQRISDITFRASFDPLLTGTFTILVGPDILDFLGTPMDQNRNGTAGEVADRYSGQFQVAPDLVPPRVLIVTPNGLVNAPITAWQVEFTEAINPATFTVADVSITTPGGALPGSSVTITASPLNNRLFTISVPTQSVDGQYVLNLNRDIRDLAGNQMVSPYTSSSNLDTFGPRVTAVSLSGVINAPIDYVDVAFSERLSSFSAADVRLSTPNGVVATGTPQWLGGLSYRIPFATQRANGSYSLRIGPDVRDAAGNNMNIGAGGGVFIADFTIALADMTIADGTLSVGTSAANFGTPLSVSWRLHNAGALKSPASWTDQIWLSTDNQWDTSDRLISVLPVNLASGIEIGNSLDFSTSVTIPLDAGLAAGNYFVIIRTDALDVVRESNEINNTQAVPLSLTYPPLPDLVVVANSILGPASLALGSQFTLKWAVDNIGNTTAAGPWIEKVYLASTPGGADRQLVGQFNHTGNLTVADPALLRSVTLDVPQLGIGGPLYFIVELDAGRDVFELNETNTFASSQTTNVPLVLGFGLSSTALAEGGSAVEATLTRNGSIAQPLTVSLSASVANQLNMPAQVTIPAGQYVVRFSVSAIDDSIIESTRNIVVTATATNYPDATVQVALSDNDFATLSLSLTPSSVAEGASLTARVTRNQVTADALTVALVGDRQQFSLPLTVTIPANQAFVEFPITVTDDVLAEPAVGYSVVASAAELVSSTATLTVPQNDVPTLGLTLPATELAEGSSGPTVQGTVTRSVATSLSQVVSLLPSDATQLIVPSTVTIPAGATSVSFAIQIGDDALVNGSRNVSLTARPVSSDGGTIFAQGNATRSLTILDNDGPTLSLTVAPAVVAEGGVATLTVRRNTLTNSALTVGLVANLPDQLQVPTSVTIPAGSASIDVTVVGLNDRVVDGDKPVVITVSSNGFTSGVVPLLVTDVDLPDLIVSSITGPASSPTGQLMDVSALLSNIGLSTAFGTTTQRVYFSSDAVVGNDVLGGQFDFTGPLPVNQTYNRTLSVRAPSVPGQYWLVVQADVADALHEGLENNNFTTSLLPVNVVAAYSATVSTSIESAPANTLVPLVGSAQRIDGSPAAFEQVSIHVLVRGTERILNTFTDASGNFATMFRPLPGEGGLYTIGATHPGVPHAPGQDSFRLLGMRATLGATAIMILEGGSTGAQIDITNMADVAQTGLQVEVLSAPSNLSVTVSVIGNQTVLTPGGTLAMQYDVDALSSAIIIGQVQLRVTTDQSRAGAAADLIITLNTTVVPLAAKLELDQPTLSASMLVGDQTTVDFTVTNRGGRESGPLTLELPAGASWLQTTAATSLPSLAAGASTTISLALRPTASLPITLYNGSLVLRSDTSSLEVPFSFRAVATAKGDVRISVVDEYYYFTEAKPLVTTSVVVVRDPFTGEEILRSTPLPGGSNNNGPSGEGGDNPSVSVDAQGRVSFSNLPAGPYELEVISADHEPHVETIEVSAGTLTADQVFVSRNFVKYNWTVEQVEVEDRTRVVIESVFETNVPAPVVTVDGEIDLSELTVVGQTQQYNLKITNHGLISAFDVALQFGNHPNFRITPLVDTIGTLTAKSEVTVPVIVTRIAGGAGGLAGAGEGEGAELCAIASVVVYRYVCKDDVWKAIPIAVFDVGIYCGPGGGPVTGVPSGGGGTGRVTPRLVPVTHSTQKGCDCKEVKIFEMDVSEYVEPPLKAAEAAINAFISTTGLTVELDPTAKAEVSTCCENTFLGIGLNFSAKAGVDATITVGPAVPVPKLSSSFPTPDGGTVSVSGELFAGIQAYISAGISGSITSGCNFSAVEASLEGSLTLGFRGGVDGSLTFSKSKGLLPIEVEVASIVGKIAGEVTGTISYSTASGLHYCLDSEGIYLEISVNVFGVQWSPFDKPETAEFETRYYFVDAASICSPSGEGQAYFDSQSSGFTKSLQDRLGIKSGGSSGSSSDGFTRSDGPESVGGSCAQVRLEISQDAVLTRTAFRASLELDNVGVTTAVSNLKIDISVYDINGQLVDDLFTVLPPDLRVIDAVDGRGQLAANSKGRATWTIYANPNAAPATAMTYAVGGVMSYTQNGQRLVIPMAKVPITVLPDAELNLDYFLQRDVLADDPFTEQVEPSVPFSLAVMVSNVGAGIAKNLRIESSQPRIKENEKGLLIDFEIIGTSVNGQPVDRTLVAQMGNVGPGQLAFAEWQMLSSLQGLFVEYEARFEHLSGLGDNRLSLIKRVNIHELIRSVDDRQTGRIDALPDFLVNDLPDLNDLPDTLYLSDGSKANVSLGSNAVADGAPQLSDLQVGVTATMPAGWSYLSMSDPSGGSFKLVGVRRSDGTTLPIKNFWQTDRTFIGNSQRPVLENKIHLLDLNSTGAYTFIFSNGDLNGPSVTALGSTIVNPAQAAIDMADVTFSEAVDLATFDRSDLILRKNGTILTLPAGVTISYISGSNYAIQGLSTLTGDDAVYELTVVMSGVQDIVGNAGTESKSVVWAKGQSAPAIVDVLGLPQNFSNQAPTYFDVSFTEPIDLSTFTAQDMVIQRSGTNLDLSSATITQLSDRTYRVGNLGPLLAPDGLYRVTVNASGILDMDAGLAGFGSRTATWTLDRTAPTIVDVVDVVTDPRNTVVQRIDVEFSEQIDLASFDVADITLTRDAGTTNLLTGDNRVTIAHLIDNIYRISGINWVQGFVANPAVAQFTLTVAGSGVVDRAGNVASGSASESWTIDLERPLALTNLQITSPVGPIVNGVVPSVLATVSATTAEAGLTIAIRDMTSDQELARQTITGTTFAIPIRFPSPGNHQLRVRQIDAAGNTTDFELINLFVLDTPPVIESITNLPAAAVRNPLTTLTINFVAPIDMSTIQLSDLRLTRNGGANLMDNSVTLTPQANGRSVLISNLNGLTSIDGLYEFTVLLPGVVSTTGIAGTTDFVSSWKLDRVAPQSALAPLAATQPLTTFPVRVNGSDPNLSAAVTGSGVVSYEVYVSTDGGAFSLWQVLPADQPTTDYTGSPNHTYAFRSLAVDAAGNKQSTLSGADATTFVPDLIAPITTVVSLNTTQPRVQISVSGTDAGADLRFFDVYVQIDGADPTLVSRVPAGTANAQGLYQASLFYNALTDGQSHNYRIFTRGVDGSQNMEEAPGETKGLSFTATYVVSPKLLADPVFGDGSAQRSLVDKVVLTFDGPVVIQAGALRLTRRDTGELITTSASSTINGQGQMIVTLAFTGASTRSGALLDGYYQLAIDGTKILRNGLGLDINGDGIGGDSKTMGATEADNYFALYGDTNGDGQVGIAEFGQFRSAFGKTSDQAGYDRVFDYESDGAVGISDFGQFRARFGKNKLPF